MKLLSLLIPLSLALPSTSIFILLPLYLYPGDNGTAWDDVTSTIAAYPSAQWQIIINPNSGPGTTGYPSDPNIISGLARLNSYPNVQTVGYVDTKYTNRAISEVNAQTDVYASWAGYSDANIAIGGIFFDDVEINDPDGSGSVYSYYAAVAAHARSSFQSSSSSSSSSSNSSSAPATTAPKVVFNPGTRAPAQLFAYADTVVEFEDSFAVYGSEDIIDQIPADLRGKSMLMINTTPEGSDVGGLIGAMAGAGIEAVYFGQDRDYKVYSKALLQGMAQAVQGALPRIRKRAANS